MNTVPSSIAPVLGLDEITQIISQLDLRFYDEEILPHLTSERGEVNAELLRKAFKKNPNLVNQLGTWLGSLWENPTEIEAQLGDVLLHPKVGYFTTYPDSPDTINFLRSFLMGVLNTQEQITINNFAQIKLVKAARLFAHLLQLEGFPEAFMVNTDLSIAIIKLETLLKNKEIKSNELSFLSQLEILLNKTKAPALVNDPFEDLGGAVLVIGGRAKKKQSTSTVYQQKFEYLRGSVFRRNREEIILALLGIKITYDEDGKPILTTAYELVDLLSADELWLWGKLFDWVLPLVHDNEIKEFARRVNRMSVVPVSFLLLLHRIDPDRGQQLAEILFNDLQRAKLSDAISQGLRGPIIEGLRLVLGLERVISEESAKFSWFQLVDNERLQQQVANNVSKIRIIGAIDHHTEHLINFLLDLREQLLAAESKLKESYD